MVVSPKIDPRFPEDLIPDPMGSEPNTLPSWSRLQQRFKQHVLCPGVCAFPGAAVAEHHRQGGSEQRKFIISQLWRVEVPNQGAGRPRLLLQLVGEGSFLSPAGFAGLLARFGVP